MEMFEDRWADEWRYYKAFFRLFLQIQRPT
jgi:hypothetical protein